MPDRPDYGAKYKSWEPGFWDRVSPDLLQYGIGPGKESTMSVDALKRRIAEARSGAGGAMSVGDFGITKESDPEGYSLINWLLDEYVLGGPKYKGAVSDPNAGWPEGLPPPSSYLK